MLLFLAKREKKIARLFFSILYVNSIVTNLWANDANPISQTHNAWYRGKIKVVNYQTNGRLLNNAFNSISATEAAAIHKTENPAPYQLDQVETSGPSQPEMKSFESVNTNNMVDLFTGDFSYNIPLLDVGGYPVSLHYSSGITMDQEASWVGLGWNINPGTISRNLRGMPDDFDGTDSLLRTQHIKENKTVGVKVEGDVEVFGNPGRILSANLSAGLGVFRNTYNGYGIETSVGIGGTGKTAFGSLTGNLSISNNSQTGLTVSPSLNVRLSKSDNENNLHSSLGMGTSYYSRGGISSLQFNGGIQSDKEEYRKINQYAGANNSFPLATISFAVPAYSPTISLPMTNTSYSFTGKVGGEASGVHPSVAFTGYVNKSEIVAVDTTSKIPAIGYLYFTKGNERENVLLDFNREKEMEFNYKTTPHIALPQYTYDAFSISGEGTGGSFRAYRGDVGYIFDHAIITKSNSANGSIDVGFGGYAHGGLELTKVTTTNENHRWSQGNLIEPFLSFRDADTTYEPVYFRNPGEKTTNPKDYYRSIGDDSLIRIKLSGSKDFVNADKAFIKYSGGQKAGEIPVNQVLAKKQRDKRTQVITYMNAKDASILGLDKNIISYAENSIPVGSCMDTLQIIPRVDGTVHKVNHISEISVLNSDGRRYIYGIPVYNVAEQDVTFAVDKKRSTSSDILNGLIAYNPGTDNSTKNVNGKDGYYSKDSIPAYAHSFLLSGILSPDYLDITGNGISEDDPGDAIKFNYTEVYGVSNGYYSWRTPMASSKANYNEGLKTYSRDDKGTYIFGKKELWYLNSIESKTMIAVFTIANDRKDTYAAKNENGNTDITKATRRLDKIDLYTKADLIKNGAAARPIKTVHFAYSYDLCKGVMNNASIGKLTLDSLWFTYNNNNKGKLNPYVFKYYPDNTGKPQTAYNPSYNTKNIDRWGTYKNPAKNPSGITNTDYPYSIQDSTFAAQYASSWHLTDIKLPSGGQLHVTYESDDYGFVQNKRATQMFAISGIARSGNNSLYDLATKRDYDTIYVTTTDIFKSKADIKNKYLGIDSILYFKLAITMPTDRWGSGTEMVPGYGTILDYGISKTNSKQFWIKLAPVEQSFPMTRAALQFLRLNLPSKAYPTSEVGDNIDLSDAINMLVSGFPEIKNSVQGFDNAAKDRGWCNSIVLAQSFVRLSSPNYKKYGGGLRVKRIQLYDNWNAMTGQKESVYGQEYNYATTENVNGQSILMSSGVASYEPVIGGEENAWRMPVNYVEKLAPLAPVNYLFSEEPIGESFFPSPMVGYSKVRVRTINAKAISANGWDETEFYTTRDFPTIVEHTLLESGDSKTKYETSSSILRLNHKNHVTLSQGFRIELNDMNGKMKAQSTYAETDSIHPIRYTLNFYKVDDDKAYQKHLNNQVWVVDSANGHIDTTGQIGKDIEIMADLREQHSMANTIGFSPNVDVIQAFAVPLIIPSFYNFPQNEDVRFRSAAIVKVVQRYGILDSVVAMDKGSVVSTKNIVYDGETGNVLLSRTNNEFNDPVYNFNYPAYWAYSGMDLAYKNINAIIKGSGGATGAGGLSLINGRLYKENSTTIYPVERFLESGDELYVDAANVANVGMDCRHLANAGASWTGKLWVIDAAKGQQNDKGLYFIDSLGRIPPNMIIKYMHVIRSGKRNMPDVSAGSVVMLGNPLKQISGQYRIVIDSTTRVLNASAATYKDLWKVENTLYQADSAYKYSLDVTRSSIPAKVSLSKDYQSGFSSYTGYPRIESNPSYAVSSYDYIANKNNHKTIEYKTQAILDFDLKDIPSNATVLEAGITFNPIKPLNLWTREKHGGSIFSEPDYNFNWSDPSISWFKDSYTSYLQRIIVSPYSSIYKITTTSLNQGTISGLQSSDCTVYTSCVPLIQDIISNPSSSFGILMKLQNEGPIGGSTYQTRYLSFSADGSKLTNLTSSTCKYNTYPPSLFLHYTYPRDTIVKVCRYNIVDSATNPYRWGILGNWRMERAYTYYNARQESDASITASNVRIEGTLKSFIPFWTFNTGGITPKLDTTRWVWNSIMSDFNRKGSEIENYDPLKRYNSGLYGYNQTMPVAVAQNSKYRELLYDGFEDYGYKTTYCSTCTPQREYDFLKNNSGVDTTTAQSHTGLYSLKVMSGSDGKLTVPVVSYQKDTASIGLIASIDSTAQNAKLVVGAGRGLTGTYYASRNVWINPCTVYTSTPSGVSIDTTINFDWTSNPPVQVSSGSCPNVYQVNWTGAIQPNTTDTFFFHFVYNGTATVKVNGIPIIYAQNSRGEEKIGKIPLTAGSLDSISIQYNKGSGDNPGKVQLYWSTSSSPRTLISKNFLYTQKKPSITDTLGSVKDVVSFYCEQANTVKPVNVIRSAFSPVQGSKLSISAWVRLDVADCNTAPALDSAIQVNFNISGIQATHWLKKTGFRIEGWQRYEDTLTVPANATEMYIHARTLSNTNIYVDDIRMQPFNSNVKGYVYNPVNLRLMADLDENNYATFYEYDDDGTLIRVKKETERGVMTIKETRSALFKDQ